MNTNEANRQVEDLLGHKTRSTHDWTAAPDLFLPSSRLFQRAGPIL